MADTPTQEDELAGTEQPFVQHLMELRDRLVKAIIAIAVAAAFLFFFPGPGPLYDFLAAPLVAHLPKGATSGAARKTYNGPGPGTNNRKAAAAGVALIALTK